MDARAVLPIAGGTIKCFDDDNDKRLLSGVGLVVAVDFFGTSRTRVNDFE